MNIPEATKQKIYELLAQKRTIEAIKVIRDSFGLSLKDAKDLADSLKKHIPAEIKMQARTQTSGPRVKSPIPLVFGIFFLVGTILTGIAVVYVINRQSSLDSSVAITGEVINLTYGSDRGISPVVQFEWAGKLHEMVGSVASTPPAYDIGEEVTIYLRQSNPEDAIIGTFSELWLVPTILGGIGGLFMVMGSIVFFVFRPRHT